MKTQNECNQMTYSLQERCILDGTLTVNYEQVDTEYRLRHNDLLANIVHRSAPAPASHGFLLNICLHCVELYRHHSSSR